MGRGHPTIERARIGPDDPWAGALELACRVSGTKASAWMRFSARTRLGVPFRGLICSARSDWLGSLYVLEVAGDPAPQFIRGMPSLEYPPADAQRRAAIVLDRRVQEVRFYAKLDGTNVTAFALRDQAGALVEVNYKTRRSPTIEDMPYGDFRSMLDRLGLFDRVERAVLDAGCPLSFELWGRANEHIVRYESDLALTLHTGVAGNNLLPPARLDLLARHHGLERPAFLARLARRELTSERVREVYEGLRAGFEQANRAAGRNVYVTEGAVMVLATPRTAQYLKCKPPSVEELHSDIAALEKGPRLTPIAVKQTLLALDDSGRDLLAEGAAPIFDELAEEFGAATVERVRADIEREFALFARELALRARVFEVLDGRERPLPSSAALVSEVAPLFAPDEGGSVLRAVERYLATR